MKNLFRRSRLTPWLLATVSSVLILHTAAEVYGSEPVPFSGELIRALPLTLPNGDAADAYFPNIPERLRKWFTDAFPVVAVLQGAQVDKSHYEQFGHRLARHGFVVVIANHFRSLAPGAPPLLFTSRTVITNVLSQMQIEDANPQSPLYRVVDTNTLGLAGHSFGGVVGLFASAAEDVCLAPVVPPFLQPFCDGQYARPAALRATAFYGTSLVQNGALVWDINTTGVATALLQGTRDGLSPLTDAELTYPTLESPRALITIEGANHYGICDVNNPRGAIPDPSPPTIEQEEAVARVARWTGLWLRAQLQNDPTAKFWIYTLGGSLDEVVQVQTD